MKEYAVKMGVKGAAHAVKASPAKPRPRTKAPDIDAIVAKAVAAAVASFRKAAPATPVPPTLADTITKHIANYCPGSTPSSAKKTTATSNSPLDVAVALGQVNPIPLVAATSEAAASQKPHPDAVTERATQIARRRNDVPGVRDIMLATRQLRNEAKR